MLSILIAAYNQDVNKLVKELKRQCQNENIEYLISVYDDKSTSKWKRINAPLHHSFNVNYVELSKNIGRAKIRNWMASSAPHQNLLFLDGDSYIIKNDFIKNYVSHVANYQVICGGTMYKPKKPKSKSKILHWKYGSQKESLNAQIRNRHSKWHFHSNNFMIKSSIFDEISFDESIKGYGYEDLMLAIELTENNYTIQHIDNQVLHVGIDTTAKFLEKKKNAIKNLAILYKNSPSISSRLIKTYQQLANYKLFFIVPILYNIFNSYIYKNLYGKNPNLFFLQFLKLYWFYDCMHKYNESN